MKSPAIIRGLLFFLFFFFYLSIFGVAKNIVWTGQKESLNIGKEVLILKDEENTKTIDWVASAAANNLFFSTEKRNIVFLDSHFYWMKITVENNSTDKLVLELAQPVIKSVEFYYQDEETGKWEIIKSGYSIPLTSKTFKHTYQTFPLPKSIGTYYLKFQSNSFSVPVRIWEENHYIDKIILERLAFGVFSGLMLFAVLLNIFLFLSFRKWVYLHYALLVTLFYFIASCVEGYSTLLAPHLDLMYGVAILAAISMPVGTSYGLIFLEAKRYSPKMYKAGIALVIYYIIFLVFHFWLEPLPLHVLTSIGGLVNVAFTVILAYLTWKKGNQLGFYYFLIHSVFFAMAIVDSVNRFTGYPPSIFELSYISFAFLFEAFALSYLLTKRFEWERTEMMEAKIISDRELLSQMHENEKIIKNQNLLLEKKVLERTQQLQAEKQKSEQASLDKSQFLSVMSHEIRTPMNAVIGLTHFLIEENPRPDQLENLQTLQFSAEKLMVLINNILDFNKIDSGKLELEHVPFDLRIVIYRILHSHSFQANKKSLKIIPEIDGKIPQELIGDPVRVGQIVNNLISNAIKFTDSGFVNLKLELEKRESGKVLILFRFVDSGIGISEEKSDTVFEAFAQASTSINRKYGGTGLGLAIVKRLVELHGGKIKLKSKPNKGSTFEFTLEFEISEEKVDSLNKEKSIPPKSLKEASILVAEDNSVNQIVLKKFLTKWNTRNLVLTSDGEKALEEFEKGEFNLVLLDLQMPELDGFSVARAIRNHEDPVKRNIPILVLTATNFQGIKTEMEEIGINDFIIKPFKPENLYEKLSQYLPTKYN